MTEEPRDARTKLLAILISIAGLVFLSRLFQLQVIRAEYFDDLAKDQYAASSIYGMFDRGIVFTEDRFGTRLALAALDEGYTLAINPKQIENSLDAFDQVSAHVPNLNRESFLSKAEDKNDPYEEIEKRLEEPVAKKIESLGIKGVILVKDRWRHYPAGSLGAQALGFVGWKGDVLSGRYGIESYFEDVLSRAPSSVYRNFFSQMFSNLQGDPEDRAMSQKGNIVITLEPKVSALAEQKAKELFEHWNAKQVGILIMDPRDGDILAMTQWPSFNPNKYGEVEDLTRFKNSFVEDVFEMGSIMKPITIAAAIDAGVVNKETTYVDTGSIEFDDKSISNFDGVGRGRVSMQEVLSQSLNTGSTFAALALGRERFRDYMYKFGFQEPTGVDLPGEVANLVDNLESKELIEVATASFGQGIAVTPLSMTRALAALGNGGYIVKPRIVKGIELETGDFVEFKATEQGRAISTKASEDVTAMLVKVVDSALMHGKVKKEHYSIAAKTGTAQISSPEGGYHSDKFMHSFFGYLPAYEPKFLVFMFMREPVGALYASETLTTPFMDIADFLINYYEIPPDR